MPENTPEQDSILSAAREGGDASLMIQAYAGCGKTSTLVLLAGALPPVPSLALAFNVKIKKELEARFPKHFQVKTLNGLGHSAWGRAIGKKLTLEDRKLGLLTSEVLKESKPRAPTEDWEYVRGMVEAAMNSGLVPHGFAATSLIDNTSSGWKELSMQKYMTHDPELCSLANEVLCRSIRQGLQGMICFSDQIYLSALFGGRFDKFPIVMVDEAQDLSPLNHIQLSKVSPTAGRLIVVGDRHQAIYAWRGASTNSMDLVRALKRNWIDLTLSETFRVPRTLVERQHHHVPLFRAFKNNSEGVFHKFFPPENTPDFSWTWQDIRNLRDAHGCHSVAFLCRNNAPLFSCAFRLIRQGTGVTMLGRDIGKSLGALAKKIIPDECSTAADCVRHIQAWIDKEVAFALANGRDDRADAAHDRGYCLIAVAETAPGVNNRKDLVSAIDTLFSKTSEPVTLATGHRSKGLEWDMVVHLDPWRIPSSFSKTPSELEQEANLKYVIETRSKRLLAYANMKEMGK